MRRGSRGYGEATGFGIQRSNSSMPGDASLSRLSVRWIVLRVRIGDVRCDARGSIRPPSHAAVGRVDVDFGVLTGLIGPRRGS